MWSENKNRESNGFFRGWRGRGGNNSRGNYRMGYRGNSYNKRSQNNNFFDHGKRTKFEVSDRLKEVDVGVTEFIGDHEHFSGIVKERFGDFHVHEITTDGVVSKLTSRTIPENPNPKIDLNDVQSELTKELLKNIETLNNRDNDTNMIKMDVTNVSKEERRILHEIVRQNPPVKSETVEKDGKKELILFGTKRLVTEQRHHFRSDSIDWSARGGPYCHFLLHKSNMDTMDALNQLAHNLRLKPNYFSYAGTKDRRARTTQWICIRRVEPKRILQAVNRIHNAYVGNFKFVKEPLKLGMLSGNRFTIILRNVTAPLDVIEKAITSLRNNGFLNYYGLQRFGSVAAIPTHEIGKMLLQEKWNEAIDLILKPREGERKDMAEARVVYTSSKNAAAALSCLTRFDKIEAKLLKGIQLSGPKNPQGALDSIPRNTRLMYIHSYQSYIWNLVVSRRIREFGRKPIVGDLVYETPADKNDAETLDYSHVNATGDEPEKVLEDTGTNNEASATEEKPESVSVESDMNMESTEKSTEEDTGMQVEEANEASNEPNKKEDINEETDLPPLPNVKVLTEEDLKDYSLADIVMPQPGWRITYPKYAKAWYDEYLTSDGFTTNLKHKNKKYSLTGTYRKILQVPENLTWRMINYENIHDDLILSDIDELENKTKIKDIPEGKYKALILEMSLKPSAYATMALREILQHDTSAKIQAAQSAAHHAQDAAETQKVDNTESSEEKNTQDKVEKENSENKMEITEEIKQETEIPMEAEPIETQTITKDENKE